MGTASGSFSQESPLHYKHLLLAKPCQVNPVQGIHPYNKFAFPLDEKLMAVLKDYIPNIVD